MKEVSTIGLDLAKNVFQVHGVDGSGKTVIRRQLRRGQVLPFFKRLPPCLVGIEACATSHYWAREITALGHEVRMMPARYVKPYVKRNKNDLADAEAICEAVTRPTMRFVPIKTPAQQSILMLHRTRELFVRQRIMLVNSLRAHLAEFGIVAGVGRNGLEKLLEVIADDQDARVPTEARSCLLALRDQLVLAKQQILEADRRILAWHRASELSRRLDDIPGVGPLIATALVASIPDPQAFKISKAGNRYLRKLLVVGALSVIRRAKQTGASRHPWLVALMARRSTKVAAIALANKIARIAWAMMVRGTRYQEPLQQAA
jgi:transposase